MRTSWLTLDPGCESQRQPTFNSMKYAQPFLVVENVNYRKNGNSCSRGPLDVVATLWQRSLFSGWDLAFGTPVIPDTLGQSEKRWSNVEPVCPIPFSVGGKYLTHSKRETLNQCWFDVGPASSTLA